MTLHPTAGLRAAWINQHFDVLYNTIVDGLLLCKNKINFKGAGLRAGLDVKWNLICGFSFLGRTHLDILWSKFDVTQRNRLFNLGPRSSIDDSIHALTPVVELFLGLVWEKRIFKRNYINMHVGWEEQYFVNMIQWNQFTSSADAFALVSSKGGLGLSGLTAGITYGF